MASLTIGESIFKYYPESWTPNKSDERKRIRVKWKNDANRYDSYKGIIQKVSGKKIKILFDDGSSFNGNPNKRSDNPIQNGYIMIKEIKIMDPEKYSGFEKHAIGIELEKESLGGAGFRKKYGIKKPPVHLGKPLNTQVPIGSNYQANIPPKQGGRRHKRRKTRKKQKGGERTPGNWIKYNEILPTDICIRCNEQLMNPQSPEKTAYFMMCGCVVHTDCLRKICNKEDEDDPDDNDPDDLPPCPGIIGEDNEGPIVCGLEIWESCTDVDEYLKAINGEESEMDSSDDILANPHNYWRIVASATPTASAPIAGGARRRRRKTRRKSKKRRRKSRRKRKKKRKSRRRKR